MPDQAKASLATHFLAYIKREYVTIPSMKQVMIDYI